MVPLIVGAVRHYIRTVEKITSTRLQLTFSLRAKKHGLIPKSLKA